MGQSTGTMPELFEPDRRRQIRGALALTAYRDDLVRLTGASLAPARWLVASPRGVFAVGPDAAELAIHGWFFGICRDGEALYLFENCALRERRKPLGRLLRLRIAGDRLVEPQVLAKGLDANCHQVRVIDGMVCLVDSVNQTVLRFSAEGGPVDARRLFPPAETSDTSGGYVHANSSAQIEGRVAVMLHNGKSRPERPSEIAWLDQDWQIAERMALAGHSCHDLVEDGVGGVWYCASMSGEIAALDGRRVQVSDRLMTRGLAYGPDGIAVGVSSFGPRQLRDSLGGGLVLLDRRFQQVGQIALAGPPTDIVVL